MSISVKIERYARANGMSYSRAAAEMGKRSGARRRAQASRRTRAEENDRRFQQMRKCRPDLY